MSVPVRPAATVVLLREASTASAPLEFFLVRRAAGAAFLAGAHVFPGGRVDPEDGADGWLARVDGLATLVDRLRDRLDAASVLAHAVAGVREVFEETGVLLGRVREGDPASEDAAARAEARLDQLAGRLSFDAWCVAHRVRLALGRLVPWARWITPPTEVRRFDTWFFLALAPPAQEATIVPGEASEGAWWTAGEALARHRHGEISLAPPTLRTLEELASHATWPALLDAATRRALTPVLPRVLLDGSGVTLVLPGDEWYGDDTPRGVEGPTRFVLRGKRWESVPGPGD